MSVTVSETGDPRRRTIRGVGRGSSCDPGERGGGRARQESMAARRDTRPRHAPAPEGYGTLPPPKAAAHHLRRLRCQRPLRLRCTTSEGCGASAHPPMAGDIPRAASPPPTADGARRRDIKRILAVFPRCERFVRQFAADNDPQTPFSPTFSPEITDAPVQAGNYRQQGIFGSRFRRKVRRFFTMLSCKSSLCDASAALRREVIACRPSP